MKIRYNIANHRKINTLRFFLLVGIVLVAAVGFLLVGVLNLSTHTKQFQDKKKELRSYQDQKTNQTKKNRADKEEINHIKQSWKRQRKFVNDLIDAKVFPYLERLDKLEELLPAGVFISRLVLTAEDKTRVEFHIAAISSAKLLEAYKAFLKYNLVITKETQTEGLYRANLQIRLGN